jgi:hypothetical protein
MNKETKILYVIGLIIGAFTVNAVTTNQLTFTPVAQAEQVETKANVTENEKIDTVIVKTEKTQKDIEEPTRLQIQVYLDLIGESDNWSRWEKIISTESKWDVNSQAPTYWSICDRAVTYTLWGYTQPANNFIELRDYPNGIWQATCEELGANTLKTGYSHGLTHIITPTWELYRCEGNEFNWHDELTCAVRIKNATNWRAWSYI